MSLSNSYNAHMWKQYEPKTDTILILLVFVWFVLLFGLFSLYTVIMAHWSLCVFLLLLSCDVAWLKKKKSVQTLSRGKIRQCHKYNAEFVIYCKPICIVNITFLYLQKSIADIQLNGDHSYPLISFHEGLDRSYKQNALWWWCFCVTSGNQC